MGNKTPHIRGSMIVYRFNFGPWDQKTKTRPLDHTEGVFRIDDWVADNEDYQGTLFSLKNPPYPFGFLLPKRFAQACYDVGQNMGYYHLTSNNCRHYAYKALSKLLEISFEHDIRISRGIRDAERLIKRRNIQPDDPKIFPYIVMLG